MGRLKEAAAERTAAGKAAAEAAPAAVADPRRRYTQPETNLLRGIFVSYIDQTILMRDLEEIYLPC